ncbi:MAG TPA: hypothetical protein VMW67_05760 [Desulfobacteria bacterium]|nr:hypothetical protein [Desulfobacteria bacterium]
MNIQTIMMVSTVVIAMATLTYASLTYFLLREQRREKEKPRIQEIGDVVILPLIKTLEKQKSSFSKGDFNWTQNGFYYKRHQLAEFHGVEKLIYEDFTKAFPDSLTNIEKYNQELNKQTEVLDIFADKLRSLPDFKGTVDALYEEYKRKLEMAGSSYRILVSATLDDILEDVVNNRQNLNSRNAYYEFWNLYGEELLKFRSREEVKTHKEEVKSECKNLLGLLEDILKDLKAILNDYREKYGISYKADELKYSRTY